MNREEKEEEEGKIVAAFSPGIFQEASFRSSEMQLLLTLINTRIRARISYSASLHSVVREKEVLGLSFFPFFRTMNYKFQGLIKNTLEFCY